MNRNIILTLLLLATLLAATAKANPITAQQAQQNAMSFLESKGKSISSSSLRQARLRSTSAATESYYVFNIGSNEGYVIASGDDCAPAILGYADVGYIDMDSMPVNMKSWLEEYASQIQFMQKHGQPSSNTFKTSSSYAAISPLLSTTWDQINPYNQNCPNFFGYGKCVTGCVATAMAQVMYYHHANSVNQTTNMIPSYECNRIWLDGSDTLQISVDAIPTGSLIDWENMLDSYSGSSTTIQQQAVANLMKYCGASVQMDYANSSNGGSTAYSKDVPIALKTYFNYSDETTLKYRNNYSSDNWENLIYNELNNSRPVYYSGSNPSAGHAFVCDGYDGTGYFHINWGWSGTSDGYFLLSALSPTQQGTGGSSSGYNSYQAAMINAKPKSSGPVLASSISLNKTSAELAEGNTLLLRATVFPSNATNKTVTWNTNNSSVATVNNNGLVIAKSVGTATITATTTDFSNLSASCIITVLPLINPLDSIISFEDPTVKALCIQNWDTNGDGEISTSEAGTVSSLGTVFNNNQSITSFHELHYFTGLVSIGNFAFNHCLKLTAVTIPESVITVSDEAFYSCSKLASITIPESVTTIGSSAFSRCFSLTSITIPESVTTIGSSAFSDCSGLASITIPESVTTIGSSAFSRCSSLTSITIPESVTTISDGAFSGCTGLTAITIPQSVTTIGSSTFSGCTGLTAITIPESVTTIGSLAFSDCTGLTAITIPESVTTIGSSAFSFCTGLTAITIPESITAIGSSTFSGCTGLTSITIPERVTIIDSNTFSYCSGLTAITIPENVTTISDNAFSYCSGLTAITIPESITTIGYLAFSYCDRLKNVTCLATTPPSISSSTFDSYDNLYVPMDAIDTYKNADGWKLFKHIIGIYIFKFEVDNIYYGKTSDYKVAVVCSDNPYQGVVNIPETVTYEGIIYNVVGISSGAFADATLQSLILPVTTASVEDGAFDGCHINSLVITGEGNWTAGAISGIIDNLYVMSSVTGIEGLQVNPTTIYSYSTVPSTCNDNTFTGYDGELHVPASSLASYFTAPYWSNFINIVGDAVEPIGISLYKDSIEVLVGNQLNLNATVSPSNATPKNLIWTTSDGQIATVTNGVITGIKAGECDIKAFLLDKSATCHVTVTEIAPTDVTLSQEFAKLEIGSQLTLTATVAPDNATDKQVTWASTNSAVATVDSLGHVTAVGQGECFISATCRDKQALCHVIVVDHFIYITLDEHDVRLLPNHMMTLTPTVTPANTSLVVTSSNPSVAAARMANGKIQLVGIKEGSTLITVNSTDGYAEVDSCLVRVYTLRGDVNSDGFVNITDVTSLINRLLNGPAPTISEENADANNDGSVTIADVTALISSLLSGEPLPPKEDSTESSETFTVNGVTFTMVAVEGGTFTMGATPEQGDDALDAEKPAHQVTLSSYAIGQTEVTQALWVAVMGTNPSRFSGRPNNPVEGVTWNDCQAFITQLNALTGKSFRLPTEAEWEYAARGGNKSQGYKYAGSNDINEVAWYTDNSTSTQPVATKKANELGLYDMSGNVWEWCQDYYGDYSSEAQTNPTGPEGGSDRVRRGVGWNGSAVSARVSHRSSRAPTYKYNSLGLRLAL